MLSWAISALALSGTSLAYPQWGSEEYDSLNLLPRQDENDTSADAISLTPVQPSGTSALLVTQANVGLTDAQSWQWGHDGGAFANVTGVASSPNYKYLTFEHFDQSITGLQCSGSGISFTFTDQSKYNDAQTAWNWVSGDSSRVIVAVTNQDGCGPTTGRHPYNVTAVSFGSNLGVQMTAVQSKWADVLGAYILNFDSYGGSNGLSKRDAHTVSFDKDFSNPNIFSKPFEGVTIGIGCAPHCSVSGGFTLDIETGSRTVTFGPSPSLSAEIDLSLTASGSLTSPVDDTVVIFDAPLDAKKRDLMSTRDVVTSQPLPPAVISDLSIAIGPVIEVDATFQVSNITAQAQLSLGATMSIPGDSSVQLHFPDFDKTTASGWAPTFSQVGPTLTGDISASLTFFPTVALELKIDIPIVPNFVIGVGLLAPQFTLDAEADVTTDGKACGNGVAGVSFEVDVGGAVEAFGGAGTSIVAASAPHTFQITSTSTQLFSTCIAFGGSSTTAATTTTPPSVSLPTALMVGSCNSATFTVPLLSNSVDGSQTTVVTTATTTNTQFACQAPTPFKAGFDCSVGSTCDDTSGNGCLLVPFSGGVTAACGASETNAVLSTTSLPSSSS